MKIRVNGLEIPATVFEREFQRARANNPNAPKEPLIAAIKDHLIRQALMREAAERKVTDIPEQQIDAEYNRVITQFGSESAFLEANGITEDQIPAVKKDLEVKLKIERMFADLNRYTVLPGEAQLREFHRREKSVSVAPIEAHVIHIVKRPGPGVYDQLCALRKRVMAGEDFLKIAQENSDCEDGKCDLGFFAKGQMVEEFEEIIFSMTPNEISPVFRSPFGYHIAKVIAFKDERALSYEESEENVKREVLGRMREAVVKDWIEKSLKAAKIEFIEE